MKLPEWFSQLMVNRMLGLAAPARGRQRVVGKRKPAGAKLARMAAEGRCAKGQPR